MAPAVQMTEEEKAIVQRNLARWRVEQAAKAQKRRRLVAAAGARGLTVQELLKERHQRYLLKSCRATISEIMQRRLKEEV